MSNVTFSACADRVAAIVSDHITAAAEAMKALRELEQALVGMPALDFWARKRLAEALASAAAEPISVAEARAGLEVARAAIGQGGVRKVAGQVMAAVLVVKTNGAPMGDERFRLHIEASHLTM